MRLVRLVCGCWRLIDSNDRGLSSSRYSRLLNLPGTSSSSEGSSRRYRSWSLLLSVVSDYTRSPQTKEKARAIAARTIPKLATARLAPDSYSIISRGKCKRRVGVMQSLFVGVLYTFAIVSMRVE